MLPFRGLSVPVQEDKCTPRSSSMKPFEPKCLRDVFFGFGMALSCSNEAHDFGQVCAKVGFHLSRKENEQGTALIYSPTTCRC